MLKFSRVSLVLKVYTPFNRPAFPFCIRNLASHIGFVCNLCDHECCENNNITCYVYTRYASTMYCGLQNNKRKIKTKIIIRNAHDEIRRRAVIRGVTTDFERRKKKHLVSEHVNIGNVYMYRYIYMLYVYEEIIFYPDETYLTGLSDKSLLLGTAGGKQGGGNESLKFVFLNKRRVSRHLE